MSFCADPQRRGQDRYHLNSVTEWNGDLYVTMFGTADGPTNRDRRNGRVVRVTDGQTAGETIVDGLYHPHSVFGVGDALLVVESQARAVRRVAGGPRDLADRRWVSARHRPDAAAGVWVGRGRALRRESSSLGTQNVIDSTSPLDFRTRLVELDLTTGSVGRTIDVTDLGAEIFDIRALPVGATFVPSPEHGLSERIEALETSYRELRIANRSTDGSHTGPLRQRLARMTRRFR